MKLEQIIALARPALRNYERVHYAPAVPYAKEKNVRRLHQRMLELDHDRGAATTSLQLATGARS